MRVQHDDRMPVCMNFEYKPTKKKEEVFVWTESNVVGLKVAKIVGQGVRLSYYFVLLTPKLRACSGVLPTVSSGSCTVNDDSSVQIIAEEAVPLAELDVSVSVAMRCLDTTDTPRWRRRRRSLPGKRG